MIHLLTALALAPFSGEFTMHRAIDPTTGRIATRYFLPKGWKASDKVEWHLDDKLRPVAVQSTIVSPDGATRIDLLPSETFTFQVQNGQVQGTLPPENATKALNTVLANQHENLKSAHLIVRKDLDVPTPFDKQEGLKTKGMVGILEVSFEENGQPMTELLSVTEYEGSHQGDGGLVQGITMMTQGYTLTCKGEMSETAYKTFAMVVASNRPDTAFFATVMEVSKAQQTGTPDPRKVASGIKGLPDDAKESYTQNLSLHAQSAGRIVPIYPGGFTDVLTFDGSIMSYKAVHVWMKKPDEYLISESADAPPGPGWQAAKQVS